jgi:hypothetical protein
MEGTSDVRAHQPASWPPAELKATNDAIRSLVLTSHGLSKTRAGTEINLLSVQCLDRISCEEVNTIRPTTAEALSFRAKSGDYRASSLQTEMKWKTGSQELTWGL